MLVRNKKQQLLGSVMRVCGPIFILGVNALLSGTIACSSQKPDLSPSPSFLFEERPFRMSCVDRPSPLPPGTQSWMTFSPQAPFARTRLETLDLPRREIQALTVAAESHNWIQITGSRQNHWTVQFCAEGEGNTVDEANGYLQKVSMQRTGSLLTLNDTDARGLTGGKGHLLLTAPTDAPLTVHSQSYVEVHDMAGPVRISARGRATILNTTGRVAVSAQIVDFAGSQGTVSLDAPWGIDLKLTAQQFKGTLSANAQREVRVFVPPGFQTPMSILVNRKKDFVCRVDFCSKIKEDRENGWYRFTYGEATGSSDRIGLSSESAKVLLDQTR